MKNRHWITSKDAEKFFSNSFNTIDDAYGFGKLSVEGKISLDFNSVLLLRFDEIYAEHTYKIDNPNFQKEFIDILHKIIDSDEEYSYYTFNRVVEAGAFRYNVKTTKTSDTEFELFILCYQKLLETENQINSFNEIITQSSNLFITSTWWTDHDIYEDRFFSSNISADIVGVPINDHMHYPFGAFNSLRDKAKTATEFYDECIAYEEIAMNAVEANNTDYLGVKTPGINKNDEFLWVNTYGKCLLRYKDGTVRFMVALDIFNSDVLQINIDNRIQQDLINQGLENSKVGVWFHMRHYLEGKYYFNQSFQSLMADDVEYKDETFTSLLNRQIKKMEDLNNGFDSHLHNFRKTHNSIYTDAIDSYRVIIPNQKGNDDIRWMEVRGTVVERDEEGYVQLFVGVHVDITENIEHQKEIEYLATHDILTTLTNRNYFESYIRNSLPNSYTIFVFDLDGLKLINDAFGHYEGDNVIKKVASGLNDVFDGNLFFSRIGGDEFSVLTDTVDESIIEEINARFDDVIWKLNKESISEISVSRGHKTVLNNDMEFNKAFAHAENVMYRRKLNNRSSRKSKTLDSILETMNLKTEETKEHSDRMAVLAVNTMRALNLSREIEIEEIKLLARVHDIGKITIDNQLLQKPSELTDDEFEIIKKHSEAGYKIIRNITDSDDVCNGVLYHHERFDGTGYPQGIKGKEIPIFARIISVVDSFDAMTNNRSYRQALTKKEAINEIIRCSGSQFDPDIVKAFLKANFDIENPILK